MPTKLRAGIAPALLVIVLVLSAGLAGYFSTGSRHTQRAFAPPSQPAFVRGVIQNITSDGLTLTTANGSLDLHLAPDAAFEALRPMTFDRISIGDWINGGAIANAQTLFALSGIVVIPNNQLASPR